MICAAMILIYDFSSSFSLPPLRLRYVSIAADAMLRC